MTKMTLILAGLLSSVAAFADSSKLVKVDLDVASTVLVRAELGQGDWYYWVDATACVCWVGRKDASTGGMSATFDCNRLKAHTKLTEHLAKCDGAVGTATAQRTTASEEVSKPETTAKPVTPAATQGAPKTK